MKIIISQQGKKILLTFQQNGVVDNYEVDKADDFLAAIDHVRSQMPKASVDARARRTSNVVDKFIKKRKIDLVVLKRANLEFVNAGLLTERVIRATIRGLRF